MRRDDGTALWALISRPDSFTEMEMAVPALAKELLGRLAAGEPIESMEREVWAVLLLIEEGGWNTAAIDKVVESLREEK